MILESTGTATLKGRFHSCISRQSERSVLIPSVYCHRKHWLKLHGSCNLGPNQWSASLCLSQFSGLGPGWTPPSYAEAALSLGPGTWPWLSHLGRASPCNLWNHLWGKTTAWWVWGFSTLGSGERMDTGRRGHLAFWERATQGDLGRRISQWKGSCGKQDAVSSSAVFTRSSTVWPLALPKVTMTLEGKCSQLIQGRWAQKIPQERGLWSCFRTMGWVCLSEVVESEPVSFTVIHFLN